MSKIKLMKWSMFIMLMSIMVTGCGGGGGGSSGGSSVTLPSQVTSPNPADSWGDISITQQLSWASAGGAISYDIYFGTTNTPFYQGNTTGTSYNPGTLSNSTTYYWRIDSKNSAGITAGNLWFFTTESGTGSLPVQVTTPVPSNGISNVSITQSLNWASASGATNYDVYFDTVNPPSYQYNTTDTTYNPGTLSNSTTYYWRINSKNDAGTTIGNVWSFTTEAPSVTPPAQVGSPTPSNGLTGVSTSQQLSWASASGATSYDVYFGTSSPGTCIGNQAGTSYNPGTLSNSTTYYWRIDSKNSAGTTPGIVWSFTTAAGATPPAQVTSPSPSNGSTGRPANQQLSWASASGATSYDVYFGTSSPGASIGNQAGTSYDPGVLSYNTTYYWRINSKNSAGTTSGLVWSFTTLGPPAQVASPTPSNGSTGRSTSQQISWASASGATSYDVYFGTSSPGTYKTNTTGTSYNPGTLANYTTYYWRINSKNAAGTTTGSVWSFTTAPESGSITYDYTGGQQTWTVPAGVTSITVDVRGAQGSAGGGVSGGKGGRVQTTLTVTPGETLYIYIGGSGGFDGTAGYNGGGIGKNQGGGGGGGSDIRRGGTAYSNRKVVGGGGGGGGGVSGGGGGGGGYANGDPGSAGSGGYGGGGGDQSIGGWGGSSKNGGNTGSAGIFGFGGTGGTPVGGWAGGGGGGGGYYGGGGGGGTGAYSGGGGGGGGSSYSSGTGTSYSSGYQSGNGQIIITY